MTSIYVTPGLQQEINYLLTKRTSLMSCLNDLSTLVLGSSHGDCGFNPAYSPDSFNLCSSSQDLKHSYALYESAAKANPNIRNIVLFYSVFSAGHLLERTGDKEKCVALKELFLLDTEYEDEVIRNLLANVRGRLGNFAIESAGRGFIKQDATMIQHQDEAAVAARAAGHLKQNGRRTEDLRLIKFLLAAKARKQRVFIVIPPARSDYKHALGRDSAEIFDNLFDIAGMDLGCDVQVINLFDNFLFTDAHFADTDHLLPQGEGSAMLTRIVHHHIVNAQH